MGSRGRLFRSAGFDRSLFLERKIGEKQTPARARREGQGMTKDLIMVLFFVKRYFGWQGKPRMRVGGEKITGVNPNEEKDEERHGG